eukprot:SAG31_NODE_41_length_31342_cov_8.029286_9_plen_39_part_00
MYDGSQVTTKIHVQLRPFAAHLGLLGVKARFEDDVQLY